MLFYLAVSKIPCSTEQEISMEENSWASKWMFMNDSTSNLKENVDIGQLREGYI